MIEKIKKGEILALVFDQKKGSRKIKFYHIENNKWTNCTAQILQLAKILQPHQDIIDGLPVDLTGYLDTSKSIDAVADILRRAGGLQYTEKINYKLA
jgi:hypothetical protein